MTSLLEVVSVVTALLVLCLFPAFLVWLYKTDVKPTSRGFITIDKQRQVFAPFKL